MSQRIIHWRIAKVAKALAAEAYELLAKEDAFFKVNKSQRRYVQRAWHDYIPFARQALTAILAKDYSAEIALGSHTHQSVADMKDEIYECLILDGGFKAPAEQAPTLVH